MKPVYLLSLVISAIALYANIDAQQLSLQERMRQGQIQGQAPVLRPTVPTTTQPTLATQVARAFGIQTEKGEVTEPSPKPQTGLRIRPGRLTPAEAQHQAELVKTEEAIAKEKITPTKSTIEKGISIAAQVLSAPEVRQIAVEAAKNPEIRSALSYLGKLALSTYRGFMTKKTTAVTVEKGEKKAKPTTATPQVASEEAVIDLLRTLVREESAPGSK